MARPLTRSSSIAFDRTLPPDEISAANTELGHGRARVGRTRSTYEGGGQPFLPVAVVAVVVGHHHPFFPSFLSLNLHDSSASSVVPLSLSSPSSFRPIADSSILSLLYANVPAADGARRTAAHRLPLSFKVAHSPLSLFRSCRCHDVERSGGGTGRDACSDGWMDDGHARGHIRCLTQAHVVARLGQVDRKEAEDGVVEVRFCLGKVSYHIWFNLDNG